MSNSFRWQTWIYHLHYSIPFTLHFVAHGFENGKEQHIHNLSVHISTVTDPCTIAATFSCHLKLFSTVKIQLWMSNVANYSCLIIPVNSHCLFICKQLDKVHLATISKSIVSYHWRCFICNAVIYWSSDITHHLNTKMKRHINSIVMLIIQTTESSSQHEAQVHDVACGCRMLSSIRHWSVRPS